MKIISKLFLKIQYVLWDCVYSTYRSKYQLHDSFKFNGVGISFYGNGIIEIGEDTYIGRYSSIQSVEGATVKIGKGCSISHYLMIYTENNVSDQDFSVRPTVTKKADVVIGDYCWIGAHVFINPGITIGDNSVIGAYSVVTRNVEPWSIMVGAPARLVRFKSLSKSRNQSEGNDLIDQSN